MKYLLSLLTTSCLICLSGCSCTTIHLRLDEQPKYLPNSTKVHNTRSVSVSFDLMR